MSYFESQTFDSSWSTINSSNSEAASTWSVLDSPQHSPLALGKKRELHEVPLDQVYSELPVYVWDHHIWPKLDLNTLLEAHRALAEDGDGSCSRSQNSNIHQSRIQNFHIPNSIQNSSLLEITNALQKHSKTLKLSSKKENSKTLRHTPPKRRKLVNNPTRSITKDQACFNQIQQSIIDKILNLLNIETKKYPILQKVLKSFLLEAPKKMSLIYLANLKVIVPDCWKVPVTDMRSYVEELSKDYRDLFTIACFTLKILYSFKTVEVRVRIADPVLGMIVEMPDSIRQTYHQNDDGWDEEYWLEDASFDDKQFWKYIKNTPEIETERLIANGMCSKMDLASAIYHCPTTKVEMYGLQNIQAFHHFEDTYEVDWRFVGYSVMSSNSPDEPPQNLVLSLYDISDRREVSDNAAINQIRSLESNGNQSRSSLPEFGNLNISDELGYAKMIQELHFCARVQTLVLKQFQMSQMKASELFDSLPILTKIVTSKGVYHRCQLLPAETAFPETRKQYQLRLKESERNKKRSTSF